MGVAVFERFERFRNDAGAGGFVGCQTQFFVEVDYGGHRGNGVREAVTPIIATLGKSSDVTLGKSGAVPRKGAVRERKNAAGC
ncbi:hypothetical protein Hthe01_14840 [Hydrogenophilus thermoluteolus]|nr:hypothetical protein Hthe01_14840 [Hydrogenophilus thermoluteolus]